MTKFYNQRVYNVAFRCSKLHNLEALVMEMQTMQLKGKTYA